MNKIDFKALLTELSPVVYLRQSSDEASRKQSASIPKQVIETDIIIEDFFPNSSIHEVREKISAKDPYNKPRPKWKEVVKSIVDGEFNSIICWKISRLARNELEGAEVMMLYKRGVIKAIFTADKTYYKHTAQEYDELQEEFKKAVSYSDHLSEDVTGGNRAALKQGVANGTYVWGYHRQSENEGGKYIPCKHNYQIIKQCLKMMVRGADNSEVLRYMKDEECHRTYKKKRKDGTIRTSYPDLNTVARIRHNPIYYGCLIQAEESVNLLEIPGYNFKPMITDDEYRLIQEEVDPEGGTGRTNKAIRKNAVFKPLERILMCKCGCRCFVDINKGKMGTYYAYVRCTKKNKCVESVALKEKTGKNAKGTRLKVVIEALHNELNSRVFADNKQKFIRAFQLEAKEHLERGIDEMKKKRKKLRREKADIETCLADTVKNALTRKVSMDKLEQEEYEKLKAQMKQDIEIKSKEIKEMEDVSILYTFDYDKMVELLESGFSKWKTANPFDMDNLGRIIWSNSVVFDGKVHEIAWNPIIESLFYPKNDELLNGRGERTRTFDLTLPKRAL